MTTKGDNEYSYPTQNPYSKATTSPELGRFQPFIDHEGP